MHRHAMRVITDDSRLWSWWQSNRPTATQSEMGHFVSRPQFRNMHRFPQVVLVLPTTVLSQTVSPNTVLHSEAVGKIKVLETETGKYGLGSRSESDA